MGGERNEDERPLKSQARVAEQDKSIDADADSDADLELDMQSKPGTFEDYH